MYIKSTCIVEAGPVSCSGVALKGKHRYVLSHSSLLLSHLDKSPALLQRLKRDGSLQGDDIPSWSIHVTYEIEDGREVVDLSSDKKQKNFVETRVSHLNTTASHHKPDISRRLIKCNGSVQAIWKADRFAETLSSLFQRSDNWKFYESNTKTLNNNQSIDKSSDSNNSTNISLSPSPQTAFTNDTVSQMLPYFVLIKTHDTVNGMDEYLYSKSRLRSWSVLSDNASLIQGETAAVVGTPFGSLSPPVFINSVAKGIVSNVAGSCGELILTDARCIPGTEGAAVVIPEPHVNEWKTNDEATSSGSGSTGVLLGVVVAPLCWRSNEWIGLSICCRINEIIQSFNHRFSHLNSLLINAETFNSVTRAYQAVQYNTSLHASPVSHEGTGVSCVLVENHGTWGSGVLIENSLVLTCSHVVRTSKKVRIRMDLSEGVKWYLADVIYATPPGHIFDIAVLELDPVLITGKQKQVNDMTKNSHLVLDLERWRDENLALNCKEGDVVYMVGHAVFSSDRHMSASITSGHISKITRASHRPVIIQDDVKLLIASGSTYDIKNQPQSQHVYSIFVGKLGETRLSLGASGGPLVNEANQLVGIIVCNAKDTDSDASYPHVNLAIPVEVFWSSVERYLITKDISSFKSLHCKNTSIQRLWTLDNGEGVAATVENLKSKL